MKICVHCSSHIPVSASVCPHCTRDTSIGDTGIGGVIILLMIFVFAAYKGCVGG